MRGTIQHLRFVHYAIRKSFPGVHRRPAFGNFAETGGTVKTRRYSLELIVTVQPARNKSDTLMHFNFVPAGSSSGL